MSTYEPDSWVVLKVPAGYKVLGGWSGGYLDGDSWRMNSGIVSVTEDDHFYNFWGFTGSCYKCPKGGYGLRMSTSGIYEQLKDHVTLMDEDTNWLELEYI